MSVEIKTNRAAWKAAVEAAADHAAAALAEQMMNDSRDYIPDDGEHILSDSGRIREAEPGAWELVWGIVYALYQWFGVRADGTHVVKRYTKSGTGKAWVDQAIAAHRDDWQTVVQNAFAEGFR